jgi:hypothetical protein
MSFDLEDGKHPVSFVLKPDDCARFVAFMRECEAGKKDAERYRLMLENMDYTDNGDGTGFYWHNQRGEFSFEYRKDPDGAFRPTFESVIDAALQARRVGAA